MQSTQSNVIQKESKTNQLTQEQSQNASEDNLSQQLTSISLISKLLLGPELDLQQKVIIKSHQTLKASQIY